MRLEARAKINPVLNITGRRPDGYHELELLFQPVSLCDIVEAEAVAEEGLFLTCSEPVFENEDNIVCKAYRLLKARFPAPGGFRVHIEKHIPAGAGLGGGSADAAAFIRAYLEQNRLHPAPEDLTALCAAVGADVAAMLRSRACLGRGIGEALEDIDTDLTYPLLVVKPDFSFSTAAMYGRIDAQWEQLQQRFTCGAAAEALRRRDRKALCEALFNVFEAAVPEPERIGAIRQQLLALGAEGALMTGSGSAVYGIFPTADRRDRAAAVMEKQYQIYPCEAINHA